MHTHTHLVQLLHHFCLFLLAPVSQREPLLKLLCAGKDLGQQEIQQRPQLVQVVLQGRAGDEQPVVGTEQAHSLSVR